MSKPKVTAQVEEMTKPIVESLQLELVEVEYVKEGANWYLRVYIDKPGGVDLDDCQAVSEQLDKLLDEKDPIPSSYILEVSSPGIERPLKKTADYERFAGNLINIKTFAPIDGKKSINGRLIGLEGNEVILEIDGQQLNVPLERIASARLAIEF